MLATDDDMSVEEDKTTEEVNRQIKMGWKRGYSLGVFRGYLLAVLFWGALWVLHTLTI